MHLWLEALDVISCAPEEPRTFSQLAFTPLDAKEQIGKVVSLVVIQSKGSLGDC